MKREQLYGVNIQLVTTADGIPVEMYLVQGGEHDSQILKRMHHDLPPESLLFGDSAYTNYELDDMFREVEQVDLQISRKSNSKSRNIPAVAVIKEDRRKRIETSISRICALMPQHVNVEMVDGFIRNLILFVMSFQLEKTAL